MTDVRSDHLIVYSESEVSSIDGVTATTNAPPISSFLGAFSEFMQKSMNHITTTSATLIAGDNNDAVALGGTPAGLFQGQPFSAASGGSGAPTSLADTGSSTIRKVLCTVAFSALPVVSSLADTAPTFQFVYGSLFRGSATAGTEAVFDNVPLPKASGGEIAVGWLNIVNDFTSGDAIAVGQIKNDKRATQGYDFTKVLGTPAQP